MWVPAVRRAGLDGLTFHALRHSAADLMIELGAHPRVIHQRLGHASVRTTLDVYGAALPAGSDLSTA
ncbi:MAG: tyrosine-type recombinase/integrase [Acidimicrobiales bacterium]